MPKKLPTTPRSRVKNALRMVFLRSRERAACLKAAGNRCSACGIKASVAKGREVTVEIHHRDGISNWEAIFAAVYENLLTSPEKMQCLCKDCHAKSHAATESKEHPA